MLVGLGFRKLSVGQQSKEKDKLSVPNIKVWSTFSKVVGVGKAHKYFPFMQSNDSQTATLFVPDKLLYRKIFMGAAQSRNF